LPKNIRMSVTVILSEAIEKTVVKRNAGLTQFSDDPPGHNDRKEVTVDRGQ